MSASSAADGVQFLLLAIWFALLTGFAEVTLLGVKKFFLAQFLRYGPDVVWMAPLADVFLFSIFGFGLMLLRWRWPKLVPLHLGVLVFAFLGFLSLLFMYYPLHVFAKVLLAGGLAVQTARLIAGRGRAFQALVRRSLVWMMALTAGLAVSVQGWQWVDQRQALAGLPASPPGRPNVLLIVLDTVRAQNLSLYGYHRPTTPNLERYARSGVRFDRATSPSPWTLPAHASMFTARWPNELSADWESPLDGTFPTLAEFLRDHGYATAGFVANTNYCGYEFGLNRGFVWYEDYIVSAREILVSSSLARSIINSGTVRRAFGYYDGFTRKNAAAINDNFLRWLTRQDRRPFFVFLNYFDAHEPYFPPAPFNVKFGPQVPRRNYVLIQDLRRGFRQDWQKRPPAEIEGERDAYDGAIAYLDDQLGRLFYELERRRVLENTLVIITSDHGEQFGEHRLFLHGNSLYQPLLHVPLLILFPARAPQGVTVPAPVSLRDIPATVVNLIGLKSKTPFPGRSLAGYWESGIGSTRSAKRIAPSQVRRANWGEDWYPTVKGDMQSLVVDHYHYIRNGDGREELYALDRDPLEQHDLAASEEGRPLLERFRTELKTVLTKNQAAN